MIAVEIGVPRAQWKTGRWKLCGRYVRPVEVLYFVFRKSSMVSLIFSGFSFGHHVLTIPAQASYPVPPNGWVIGSR